MNFEILKDGAAISFVATVLYLSGVFLFKRLLSKEDESKKDLKDKMDAMLEMVSDFNIKLEKITLSQENLNASVHRIIQREDDLRNQVTKLQIGMAQLQEWKNNTKKD